MAKIKKDDVVFTDIKKSLTLGQFETLMQLAQEDYDKLKRAVAARDSFEDKAKNKMIDDTGNMPPELAEKLIEGLVRKAEKEFDSIFEEELARHDDVLDFLNTFKTTENQLKNLK
mgnify:CR=1 FL=1|tara:strand:+ start:355 stop:699 length:345 start_codon:yes stop_codon:yes gene_type:complete